MSYQPINYPYIGTNNPYPYHQNPHIQHNMAHYQENRPQSKKRMAQYGSNILGKTETSSINSLKNRGIFGGGVIIEEIEVDEDGKLLGKKYKLIQDERPKAFLANPANFEDMNAYFTPDDVLDMKKKEKFIDENNHKLLDVFNSIDHERKMLERKKAELKWREELLARGDIEAFRKEFPQGGFESMRSMHGRQNHYTTRRGGNVDLSDDDDSSISDSDDDFISYSEDTKRRGRRDKHTKKRRNRNGKRGRRRDDYDDDSDTFSDSYDDDDSSFDSDDSSI